MIFENTTVPACPKKSFNGPHLVLKERFPTQTLHAGSSSCSFLVPPFRQLFVVPFPFGGAAGFALSSQGSRTIARPSRSAPLKLAIARSASCGVANSTKPVPLDQLLLPV